MIVQKVQELIIKEIEQILALSLRENLKNRYPIIWVLFTVNDRGPLKTGD